MGSRSDFVSVNTNNFTFREGSKRYESVGTVSGIEVLVQTTGSVKAPEYSHSPNRIYAIIQKGTVKQMAYYDENHRQSACIDFNHEHQGLKPHKHLYLSHKKGEPAAALNSKDRENIAKLKRRYKVKCD